ncbi:MAG: DUF4190 domain-containing protein [Propionibacteriaceae bacterium]|jgi:hypothetical protein|nr:DUF4190 domain-containing protein [Propionibacteriaceae bacterium]
MSEPRYQPLYPPPGGYAAYPVVREHPRSTTVLVMGILGLVLFAPLSIVALVMGSKAKTELAANPQATCHRPA